MPAKGMPSLISRVQKGTLKDLGNKDKVQFKYQPRPEASWVSVKLNLSLAGFNQERARGSQRLDKQSGKQ